MNYLYIYISFIIPFCIVIPLFVAFSKYKQLPGPFKILFYFLFFSAFANALNIAFNIHHMVTAPLFHIYTIFEFAFITWFYSFLFDKKWHKILYITVGIFTTLCIINFYIQNGINIDTYTGTLEGVIIIGYAILYLNQQNNLEQHHSWERSGLNWVNISFLIYYGCGLFMFMSTNYLTTAGHATAIIVYSVFDTIMLVEYLLFAIGFYKCNT